MRKYILTGYLQIFGAALLWSLTGLIVKSAVASAIWANTIRSLTAGIVLIPVMWKFHVKIDKNIALTGIIYFIFVAAFTITTKVGNSAMAVSMQSAAPLYIIIYDVLRRNPFGKGKLATFIFIGAGVALSVVDALKSANKFSIFFGFIIGFSFLAYSASLRKIETHSALGVIGGVNLVAFICNLAVLPLDFHPIPASARTVLVFVFSGIFISALSYAMYGTGIRRIGIETAMIVALVEPVLNPVWVYLGTGEAPSRLSIAGLGFILMGVVINTLFMGRIKKQVAEGPEEHPVNYAQIKPRYKAGRTYNRP